MLSRQVKLIVIPKMKEIVLCKKDDKRLRAYDHRQVPFNDNHLSYNLRT